MGRRILSRYRELLPHTLQAGLDEEALRDVINELQTLAELTVEMFFHRSESMIVETFDAEDEQERLRDRAETLASALNVPLHEAFRLAQAHRDSNSTEAHEED
jgi:hypothetical protein